jgi:gliding motility-associated-like protein
MKSASGLILKNNFMIFKLTYTMSIKNISKFILYISVFQVACISTFSQLFAPVSITGFNQDVIAESGTSSLTTTTMALDAAIASNKVMYSATFRTNLAFGGGGLADNGLITDAAGTYQLAGYNGNNALLVQRGSNADITLASPEKYSVIRLLCFSTEGSSLLNIKLTFTDASVTNSLTGYSLGDWFNNTANLVLSGFGRCTRATPASGADGYTTNPRMYYIDIPLNCTDKNKAIQKINIANVTTAGNNAPYPNAVFMALSGKVFTPTTVTAAVTNATCTSPGSATLTLTGSSSPFSVSWNTVPVQTGVTATNLAAGTYTATITDANSCTSTFPVTITATNNLTMSTRSDTSLCPGASFNPNITSNATGYAWTPAAGVSNTTILNPVLSPAVTTTYTITGTTGTCTISRSFIVTVAQTLTMSSRADTTLCSGGSFTPNIISNATNYSWTPTAGVSNPAILNPTLNPTVNTTYTLTGSTGACTISKSFTVSVAQAISVNAGNNVSILSGASVQLSGSGPAGTYLWTPPTGLSATSILNPIASPAATTTYTLRITTNAGCTNTGNVTVTVIPYCIKPLNAFSPNGDGINDKWFVTNGNCTSNIKVVVFNRYGSKVYESADYQNTWDGTYKGNALPDATYYYNLTFTLINGDVKNFKGDVSILR